MPWFGSGLVAGAGSVFVTGTESAAGTGSGAEEVSGGATERLSLESVSFPAWLLYEQDTMKKSAMTAKLLNNKFFIAKDVVRGCNLDKIDAAGERPFVKGEGIPAAWGTVLKQNFDDPSLLIQHRNFKF